MRANRRIRDGEREGSPRQAELTELFRTWRGPMSRLAYVLTNDAARSDEIVQEAFLQLYARWERVDNPAGYLRTAVVNGCRSNQRHLAVVRRTPNERPGVVAFAADELGDALATLDYPYCAVLALRFYCDLSDDEIANALSIRRATVRTRVRRALETTQGD